MGQLKNTTSIYLKFGSTKIRIPVNPEEIEIKYPSNNKKQDIIGVGEVVVQKRPGLREVSWKGFFPGENSADPYINKGAKSPQWYEKQISKAMKGNRRGGLLSAARICTIQICAVLSVNSRLPIRVESREICTIRWSCRSTGITLRKPSASLQPRLRRPEENRFKAMHPQSSRGQWKRRCCG